MSRCLVRPMKIAISGICGRMGSTIARLASEDPQFQVVGAIESPRHPCIGKEAGACLGIPGLDVTIINQVEEALKGADVLIEFTTPEATMTHLEACVQLKRPMVIGTTGLSPQQKQKVTRASRTIGIILSPNMSVGVNVLFQLVSHTAQVLDEAYDVEIVEAHHRMKKDAPSGTAKRLAEIIAEARGQRLDRVTLYGRQGLTGERPKGQIAIHAIRAGDIVGDHTVIFSAPGERIELTHRAHARTTFASGALVAARFIASRRVGLYSMQDVIAKSAC